MKIWLDEDDENETHDEDDETETHKMWECPNDQNVWCLTCHDESCDTCGHQGPIENDYAHLEV